tara:strand:+ start:4228 stop:5511 length:1284 start_codon:yes stop_codon:yes gene_type:complete
MSKPRFVISCPFDTYSGYGARSRDFVKAVIELNKYDVELLSQKWGETSWGFCKDHPEWQFLYNHAAQQDWQSKQPDMWMQITIPNEFQPVGKYNIGLTAGIESTMCKPEWIEGLNRMDINLVSAEFAKNTFESMSFEKKDERTGQVVGTTKLTKPMYTVFEGINLDTYKVIKSSEIKTIDLSSIPEQFCYLSVGHWMQGSFGHDRKNIGVTIKSFYEAFKNKPQGKKPALLLKCSIGTSSYISRDEILDRIKSIRSEFKTDNLPNVYLLNGEFDDSEVNELYNHPKVKAMVSFTKGEGFGRPLLEFGTTGKPIIASGWSGHLDFLGNGNNVLLPGVLENVHQTAANHWLIPEAKWFQVDYQSAISSMKDVYKKYKTFHAKSIKQKQYIKDNFSHEEMRKLVDKIFDDNLPQFSQQVALDLSQLTKID